MASSENKNGYYQSIKKYDGSDPTYFPAFIAAVTDHYATWRNGEEVQGIWHEHIREGGVCIEEPSVLSDELYLARRDSAGVEAKQAKISRTRVTTQAG